MGSQFGPITRIGSSHSLFELSQLQARVYVRYSKLHGGGRTFFGLRVEDLRQLEGHHSFIAFLWDHQAEPLLVPFEDFEDVFKEAKAATDGQIKAQIYLREAGTELYIARAGRFNVDFYFGWQALQKALVSDSTRAPGLTHAQVQSLLGAIGTAKSFDVWIPLRDRLSLDWSVCERFSCVGRLPQADSPANFILQEIDVIWVERGSGRVKSVYEVEHSTTIYSGLLRLNDARLALPNIESYGIVANDERRAVFARHVRRPTFQASGLDSLCSFLNYEDVFQWHERLRHGIRAG